MNGYFAKYLAMKGKRPIWREEEQFHISAIPQPWLQVPEPSELVRRFGSAVDIPAFGGRLEVNWAPGAKVTSAGGGLRTLRCS